MENTTNQICPHGDDNFLCAMGDYIDNAVFAAIQTLVAPDKKLDWDMSLIAPVAQYIDDLLTKRGINTCRPWQDDDENICYSTDGGCSYCKRGVTNTSETENTNKPKSTIKKHYSVIVDLKGNDNSEVNKNFTNGKKKNMAYWDQIDDYAFDCVSAIALMSETDIGVECNFTDINKEVVDLVTNRLKEKFGGTFPYVDENY